MSSCLVNFVSHVIDGLIDLRSQSQREKGEQKRERGRKRKRGRERHFASLRVRKRETLRMKRMIHEMGALGETSGQFFSDTG